MLFGCAFTDSCADGNGRASSSTDANTDGDAGPTSYSCANAASHAGADGHAINGRQDTAAGHAAAARTGPGSQR